MYTTISASLFDTRITTSTRIQQFYAGKKVVVTGGAGFIGSSIVELLVQLGAQVTLIDNFSTGTWENIAHVAHAITCITSDITDKDLCIRATQGASIIFHLAAHVSVPQSFEHPYTCHSINVEGTVNLLEAARINGVERFIFSSSSAVYGPRNEPCSESMICNPISPYGMSKLIGELYCKQYSQFFTIKTICLRYFNVHGPRQSEQGAYTGVVKKITTALTRNEPITIYGDGLQTRDFIHVDDVAWANVYCGSLPESYLNGLPINIASGTSVTLLDFIEQLKVGYQYHKPLLFKPARTGDIRFSSANCTRLRELLRLEETAHGELVEPCSE